MIVTSVKDFNRRFSGAPRTVRFSCYSYYFNIINSFLVVGIFSRYPGFNSSYNSTNIHNRKSCMDISFTNDNNISFSNCICYITIRYITGKCSWYIWFIRRFFYCSLLSTLYYYCFSTKFSTRINLPFSFFFLYFSHFVKIL